MTYERDDDGTFETQRERVDSPMRRLFAEYGRDDWLPLVVGLVSSLIAHSAALLPTVILGDTVDAVFLQDAPYTLPLVPQSWIPGTLVGQLALSTALIALTYVASTTFTWLKGWGLNAFAQSVQHRVRSDTYDAMQRLDLGFFAGKQTGELMSILNNDVNRLEQFLNGGIFVATMLLVNVGGVAAILLYTNWQLALLTMSTIPLIAVFTHKFVQTIQPLYAEVRSNVGQLNSRLENNLGGIEVIKATNTEGFESDRVTGASRDYYDTNWEAITTRIKFFPGLRMTAGVGFLLTFGLGGLWVLGGAPAFLAGSLSPGEFVIFVYLGQRFIWPMSQFGEFINLYQKATASAERIFGLMDEPVRLEVAEDAPELELTDGRVVYDDVTFGYEDPDAAAARKEEDEELEDQDPEVRWDDAEEEPAVEPVLEDVSFAVEGGEMLALVGPTGAGKSTALKLLLRLYDVDEGAVEIDGQDVRTVTLSSLRENVGYVSQETFLFYGSVAENIRYGSFDASREAVVEAAKLAEAHEFITELDDGYDTEVGERGVKLSGGQRQRLGIARVLLQDPEILILDEATSDVDTETELRIQQSIERLVADRTVLAIAHRLSTIKDADQIVVLEDGRVTERGSHEDLLEADGVYADLWGVQAGELDPTIDALAD